MYTQLILALIQVTPGLVTALENWFQNNPRLQGETDDAYAARMNAKTLQMAAETTANDNAVTGDGPTT